MRLYHHYSLYGFSNVYLVGNDETNEAFVVDPAEMNAALLGHIEKNGYALRGGLHHPQPSPSRAGTQDAPENLRRASLRGQRFCRRIPLPGPSRRRVRRRRAVSRSTSTRYPDTRPIRWSSGRRHAVHRRRPPCRAHRQDHEQLQRDHARRPPESKILDQSDEYIILPGHGPPSTVGTERMFNMGLEPGYAERITSRYDFFV